MHQRVKNSKEGLSQVNMQVGYLQQGQPYQQTRYDLEEQAD